MISHDLKWFWSSVELCSSTYDNKWQAAHLVGLLNLFEINNIVSEGIVYQKVWKNTTQLKTVPSKETIESFYFNGSGKMKSSFKKKSRIPSERAKKNVLKDLSYVIRELLKLPELHFRIDSLTLFRMFTHQPKVLDRITPFMKRTAFCTRNFATRSRNS